MGVEVERKRRNEWRWRWGEGDGRGEMEMPYDSVIRGIANEDDKVHEGSLLPVPFMLDLWRRYAGDPGDDMQLN